MREEWSIVKRKAKLQVLQNLALAFKQCQELSGLELKIEVKEGLNGQGKNFGEQEVIFIDDISLHDIIRLSYQGHGRSLLSIFNSKTAKRELYDFNSLEFSEGREDYLKAANFLFECWKVRKTRIELKNSYSQN